MARGKRGALLLPCKGSPGGTTLLHFDKGTNHILAWAFRRAFRTTSEHSATMTDRPVP